MRGLTIRLARDRRAVAVIEFALTLPVIMSLGLYGVEVSNLALANLRVSQTALSLADNAARVGVTSALTDQQVREADVNDIFQGVRLQSANLGLEQNGRVVLSSLETNADGGQWIHWQRCMGAKRGTGWDSSYGAENAGATGTTFAGMGETGQLVQAPPSSGVMFVEINYDFRPLLASWLVAPRKIHYVASMVVRDKRDFGSSLTNPTPTQPQSLCT